MAANLLLLQGCPKIVVENIRIIFLNWSKNPKLVEERLDLISKQRVTHRQIVHELGKLKKDHFGILRISYSKLEDKEEQFVTEFDGSY